MQQTKPLPNQTQTAQSMNQTTNSQPTQATQINEPTIVPTTNEPTAIPITTNSLNATNSGIVVPNDYIKKETLCYTYTHPPEIKITQDNSCYQVLEDTNQSYVFSITFDPLYKMTTKDSTSLDALVANRAAPYTIIQSTNMSIDGVPAIQIDEKDENSPIKTHHVRTFVYLPDKYDYLGRTIVGFEIGMYYHEVDDSPEVIQIKKDIMQKVLSSIVWK